MNPVLIDSNIFIHHLVHDTEALYHKAKEIFEKIEAEEIEALVSLLVIGEVVWVVENYYKSKRTIYIPELLKLLALRNLEVVEVNKDTVIKTLEKMMRYKFDFTDIYLSQIADKRKIYTFDKDFKKLLN